jgi:carotenoid cleavage dioxygenase-like enzyme
MQTEALRAEEQAGRVLWGGLPTGDSGPGDLQWDAARGHHRASQVDPRTGEMLVFCYLLEAPYLTWATPGRTAWSPATTSASRSWR